MGSQQLRSHPNTWDIIAVLDATIKQVLKESLKKIFRLERDSNLWPLRYRCSSNQLSRQANWELITFSVRIIPVEDEDMKVNIWNVIYLNCHISKLPHLKYTAFRVYSLSHSFHLLHFHHHITNSQSDQLPIGLIALLVTAMHRYRRGNRFESWIFFRLFRKCFSCVLRWSFMC